VVVFFSAAAKKCEEANMETWYQLETAEVLQRLGVHPEVGLDEAEARRRLEQGGPNELIERGQKSPWKILLEQLTGTMVLILIASAIISIFLGDLKDAIAILAIVVLNTLLGFTQEFRAEKAMAALKKMAAPHVRVRRGGHVREITARELVPGDVIFLEAGNTVPADIRIIESVNLRIQEAVLTGESEPVEKHPQALEGENLSPADQRNMAFMGTVVTYGRGQGVVVETGMRSQLGRIAEMIQTVEHEQTPLQRRLDQLGRGLTAAALVIVALVFILGLLRGEDIRLLVLTAISLAVAAVPEGLPAVVTIALALGAQRMLARNALIRKLPAVETLGSVTVICSDKTGTLTENRMTVTVLDVAGRKINLSSTEQRSGAIWADRTEAMADLADYPALALLLTAGALCNDAVLERTGDESSPVNAVGDPTEGALVVAATRAGLWKDELEAALPRVGELPFDSERKRMTTVHRVHPESLPPSLASAWEQLDPGGENGCYAFTKGAVDGLVAVSDRVWVDGRVEALDDGWRERILSANSELAQSGMRVLGVAFRPHPCNDDVVQVREENLIFIGLVGMIDPARPEVKTAVQTSQDAGIRPVMITGDHPLTALHIARELGITRNGHVLTGADLDRLTLAELRENIEKIEVYARVSPEHKLKLVQALQERGHIVAMTGDGVNDAPALKKADIGVAMGITGTDVSKEAADMVLLDDNFATIVAAVEEGRRIYDNVRKFIKYALASNTGEILVMLLAPFLGMPLPLLPLQILWINLVTDGLPGLALTMEPAERNIMRRPPHPPKESIFARGLGRDVLWIGALVGLVTLAVGYWAWFSGHAGWQTMAFTTLTLVQMGNALALRSERDSLFTIGLRSNKALLWSVLLTIGLQIAVIYIPFLQAVFKTQALSWIDLVISLAASSTVFFAIEVQKWIRRRRTSLP
jgi:Ca2+-transporting ATPase